MKILVLKMISATRSTAALLPVITSLGVHGTTDNFVVPERSYGFAVYPDADAPACK